MNISEKTRQIADFHMPFDDASLDVGSRFVSSILSEPKRKNGFTRELEIILGQSLEEHDPDRIVLPLTAGLDSRGLLGALLKVAPKDKIQCVTLGEPNNPDVLGAERIAANLNLSHQRIDPNDVHWSVDRAIDRAEAMAPHGIFCEAQSLPYDKIGEFGDFIITGFLGGTISGAHLRPRAIESPVEWFLTEQACRPGAGPTPYLIDRLSSFLDANRIDMPGAIPFDVLDLGLRQALRVRWVTQMVPSATIINPYSYLVREFLEIPFEGRAGQAFYRTTLREAYPDIFCLPRDYPRSFFRRGVSKLNRTFLKQAEDTSERGRLKRNPSMDEFFSCLLASFAQREQVSPSFGTVDDMGSVATAEVCVRMTEESG